MNKKIFDDSISPLMDRKMSCTISTAAVDRDGDTIDPKGWDLKSYKRNPVVLWAHDHTTPPIGRASNLWTDAKGLHATVEFPPRGIHALADQVHDLIKAGFLSATSVGFIAKESRPSKTGQAITRAELLEFSICSIPSNPQALVLQRSYDRAAVQKWLSRGTVGTKTEIDWDSINNTAFQTAVNVDSRDVVAVIGRMVPEMIVRALAGLAAVGAQRAMTRMTGRLD